jgi:hypothetical protein
LTQGIIAHAIELQLLPGCVALRQKTFVLVLAASSACRVSHEYFRED